eukprot:3341512-Amphidinium_carterae.1
MRWRDHILKQKPKNPKAESYDKAKAKLGCGPPLHLHPPTAAPVQRPGPSARAGRGVDHPARRARTAPH